LAHFFYDNKTGLLHDSGGHSVGLPNPDLLEYAPAFKADNAKVPIRKHNAIRILKIQLGLSCNYSCNYCLQKYVPHSADTGISRVQGFIAKLATHLSKQPDNIQLWGGEPLVYIKTLRPLVQELKKLYPGSKFSIITNGSLLNRDINDWLMENEIRVSISHDGPGQQHRGPDPFDVEQTREAILDLYWRKKNAGEPISVGAMIYPENGDRAEVARWLSEKFGDPEISIGEGAIIEVYDQGGSAMSPKSREEHLELRTTSLRNIQNRADRSFLVSRTRMGEWLNTMKRGRALESLGMKCGMDLPDTLTVDLMGNVITCQNTSAASKGPNGESHKGGNITDLEAVELKSSVHFLNRSHCQGCPVVQVCKGGCMYLTGELFYSSCNNTFTDHVPYFAAAVEALTGYLPVYLEDEANDLPEFRKDIFGRGKPSASAQHSDVPPSKSAVLMT
jgi:uncharacterized protein